MIQHVPPLYMAKPFSFDPTEGSAQIGYREISGDLPSTGERITLRAWAIVFALAPSSRHHYRLIEELLGTVDGNARPIARLADIRANRFGNMSERTDLLGEYSTLWVTSLADDGEARGAVLAVLNGVMVQIIATDPYIAADVDRAAYVIERTAMNMADREAELTLPPENDTKARLPILNDVNDSLENASIGINQYYSPS